MPKDKPFVLPNSECERLTRNEMLAVRWCLNMASELNQAKGDLSRRLEAVPNGKQRLAMLAGGMNSLFTDIIGTVSDAQRKTLRNTARDYSVKLVPKMDIGRTCLAVDKQDFHELVNCAQQRCAFCTKTGNEARQCKLYNLLEAYVPLDDYGDDDLFCPYMDKTWED